MPPLKLIILAGLFYILYRLIFKGKKRSINSQGNVPGPSSGATIHDILVEDPVCHVYIPAKKAIVKEIQGKKYFFCSQECIDKFQKN
jgi:YHS domain-containing protein